MGATAALKSRQVLGLAQQVLGIELVLAAQALELRRPLEPGRGTRAALAAVRARVPQLEEDRPVHADLATGQDLVHDGSVLAAVESVLGPLR